MNWHEHKAAEEAAMKAYLEAKGAPEHERIALWVRFLDLHKSRPDEVVRAMERNQGLL